MLTAGQKNLRRSVFLICANHRVQGQPVSTAPVSQPRMFPRRPQV